jgi:hypothetical protein
MSTKNPKCLINVRIRTESDTVDLGNELAERDDLVIVSSGNTFIKIQMSERKRDEFLDEMIDDERIISISKRSLEQ